MNPDDCFELGKIIKTHGFKGDLSFRLDVDFPEDYRKMESVFVQINGQLVPFFITRFQLRHKGIAAVHLEDVDDQDSAQRLVGCTLHLPLEVLPPLTGSAFYFHEVEGFQVIDQTFGPVGTIAAVYDNNGQGILAVMHGDVEVLIPINDEVIKDVDRKQQTMAVQCPEGLIELYLNS